MYQDEKQKVTEQKITEQKIPYVQINEADVFKRIPLSIRLLLSEYEQVKNNAVMMAKPQQCETEKQKENRQAKLSSSIQKCKSLKKQIRIACKPFNNVIANLQDDNLAHAFECNQQLWLIYKRIFGEDSVQCARCLGNLGLVFFKRGNYNSAYDFYMQALPVIERAHKDNPDEDLAMGYNNFGVVLGALTKADEALAYYQKALAIRKKVWGDKHPLVAQTLLNIADVYTKRDKPQLGIQYGQEALAILTLDAKKNQHEIALAHDRIGTAYRMLEQYKLALEYHQKALEVRKQVLTIKNDDFAGTLENIGTVLTKQGKYQQALPYCTQSLDIRKDIWGEDSAQVASGLINIGNILIEDDQFEEAAKQYRAALRIYQNKYSENHLNSMVATVNLGHVFAKQEKYDLAIGEYRKAFNILKSVNLQNSSQAAEVFIWMGNVFLQRGDFQQSFTCYQNALTIQERVFGKESTQVASVLMSMGNYFALQSKNDQALMYFKNALAQLGEHATSTSSILINMAIVYADLGLYEEAHRCYKKASDIYIHCFGAESSHVANLLLNIGNLLVDQKKYSEAMPCYERALTINKKIYGKKSSHVASVHASIGNVYADHGVHEEALKHCQAAYDILKPTYKKSVDAAMMLNNVALIYVAQKNWDKALEYLMQVKAVVARETEAYDIVLNNLAGIYAEQKKYPESLAYFEEVLVDRKKRVHVEHYSLYETQRRYAEVRVEFAAISDEKTASAEYQRAAALYEEALRVNETILSARGQEFSIYDMVDYNKLLHALAQVYIKQGNHVRAGQLYYEQAIRYQKMFPVLALKYSKQAIYYFSSRTGNEKYLLALYQLCAEIGHQHQRILFAIRNLLKALILDPKNNTCQQRLTQWQEEVDQKQSYIDEDLFIQLEYCQDAYHDIQLLILEELESGKFLSEQTKNRVTELIIKINNLLDMAFGRFVRTAIYQPNGAGERTDVYFPVCSSPASLIKQLASKQIIAVPDAKATGTDTKSLDKDFASLFALIQQMQPFHYYAEQANREQPKFWQQSWLEKVVAISNGSKHLGLTPQGIADNLAESVGCLHKNQMRINIHYLESQFYPWILVAVLRNLTDLEDVALIKLSSSILQQLREKKYIEKGIVVHPLARDYLQAAHKPDNYKQRQKIEQKFCEQLKNDLSEDLQPYILPIATLLLQHVLHLSQLELHADQQVEMHFLIEKALKETRAIVIALGKAKSTIAVKPALTSRMNVPLGVSIPVKPITSASMGEYYTQEAEAVAKTQPFLALHYYRKAIYYFQRNPQQHKLLPSAFLALSQQYAAQGLWQRAIYCLAQGAHRVGKSQADELNTLRNDYRAQFRQMVSSLDDDIYSQLEHTKQQALHLQYLCHKFEKSLTSQHLQQNIQNTIVDLVIKMRHLLDQTFTRFVHIKIYLPNNKLVTMHIKHAVKFYAFGKENDLLKELRKKGIIHEDKDKQSLDRDYPAIYQLLLQTQPFSGVQWLAEIIGLSNQVKHVGLKVLEGDDPFTHLTTINELIQKSLSEAEKIITTLYKILKPAAEEKSQSLKQEKYLSQRFFSLGGDTRFTPLPNPHRRTATTGLSHLPKLSN